MADYTTIEVTKDHRKWVSEVAEDFGMDQRTFSQRLFAWLAKQDRKFLQAMVGGLLQEDREWYMRSVLERLLANPASAQPPTLEECLEGQVDVVNTPPPADPGESDPSPPKPGGRAQGKSGRNGR